MTMAMVKMMMVVIVIVDSILLVLKMMLLNDTCNTAGLCFLAFRRISSTCRLEQGNCIAVFASRKVTPLAKLVYETP